MRILGHCWHQLLCCIFCFVFFSNVSYKLQSWLIAGSKLTSTLAVLLLASYPLPWILKKRTLLFYNFDKIPGQEAQQFDNYINALLSEAENKAKGYTLDIANRLYLGKNLTLKEAYLKIIASHFTGQLRQVDFKETDAVVQVRDNASSHFCIRHFN